MGSSWTNAARSLLCWRETKKTVYLQVSTRLQVQEYKLSTSQSFKTELLFIYLGDANVWECSTCHQSASGDFLLFTVYCIILFCWLVLVFGFKPLKYCVKPYICFKWQMIFSCYCSANTCFSATAFMAVNKLFNAGDKSLKNWVKWKRRFESKEFSIESE